MSPEEQGEAIRGAFGRPEYRRLFEAARDRLEQGGEHAARSFQLRGLGAEERQAIAELHAWNRIPGEDVRIDLERLDLALRSTRFGAGLTEVLESLDGPIVDRRAERELAARSREQMWSDARAAVASRPELTEWVEELRALGLTKRAAGAAQVDEARMLSQALDVVARLPCVDGVPLSVLATEETGDAHSLDFGRPLAALVLRAVAILAGRAAVPTGATERRALWAEWGGHCDALSCHVLVFGLRPPGNERLQRHLRENAEAAEPCHLTLRELSRCQLALPAGTDVFLCENPAVVAVAAEELGADCAPLVCVEGVPSTAAWRLFRMLTDSGARLRFHADFDWDGIKIGNLLTRRLNAEPWRFGHREYRLAARAPPLGSPLTGGSVHAQWDPELAGALGEVGHAVSEENVIESLLVDLRTTEFRA